MQYAHPEYLTSTDELAQLLATDPQQENLRLFDTSILLKPHPPGYQAVSGYDDYLLAHIPGAGFLDLKDKLSDPDSSLGFTLPSTDQLQVELRAAGINNSSRVVLYSSGHVMWATRAWWILHSCGHRQVSVLNGGLATWRLEDRALANGACRYPQGDFSVALDAARWVDKHAVLNAIDDNTICTINALSPDVYSGTAEMHYGRKGHIPGSRNIYYDDALQAGCFRSATELHQLFNAESVMQHPGVIAYCGGGISATIDAFALSLLGHAHISVYDGSMGEWVKDENLPLVLGADS